MQARRLAKIKDNELIFFPKDARERPQKYGFLLDLEHRLVQEDVELEPFVVFDYPHTKWLSSAPAHEQLSELDILHFSQEGGFDLLVSSINRQQKTIYLSGFIPESFLSRNNPQQGKIELNFSEFEQLMALNPIIYYFRSFKPITA